MRQKWLLDRFSSMMYIWSVSLEAPTVVCKHIHMPATLVLSFHHWFFLVKTLSLLFTTEITTVFWIIVQIKTEEMHTCIKTRFYSWLLWFDAIHLNECFPLNVLHTFVKVRIFQKFPDLRYIKNTSCQFCFTYAWKFL